MLSHEMSKKIHKNYPGERGDAICDHDDENNFPDDTDEECPLNSDEIIIIPGDYCGKKALSRYQILIEMQSKLFDILS